MTGMGRLDGKVAIVTGGARGIGAAHVRCFAAEGATVVVADRREDEGKGVVDEAGDNAVFVTLDVTSEEGWHQLVSSTIERFGGIDVLVNNAGIMRIVPLRECDAMTFRKVLDTNLVSMFLGIRSVIDPMVERGGGSIINVSSPQGFEGRAGMAAYTASKFGVRGLTKTAAIELGPLGIRVNSLVPGAVKTAMTERPDWKDSQYDEAYSIYPLERMGRAEEISAVAVFLASDESSFCTGADFVVDGGILAGKARA
jgi:3alpha(or 20beta)-hydroxysteroid dehydrogenase